METLVVGGRMLAKRIGRQLREAVRESQMPLWQLARRADVDIADAAAAIGGHVIVPAQTLDNVAQALGFELQLAPATATRRLVGPVPSRVDDVLQRLTPDQFEKAAQDLEISTLALGFEGTLIADAATPVARPGLSEFLHCVRGLFSRVVVFTSLPEPQFRTFARLLMAEGEAPDWFGTAEYVRWRGPAKDLSCILETSPRQTLLVDRDDAQVHPEQNDRWIRIAPLKMPIDLHDDELPRTLQALIDRVVA